MYYVYVLSDELGKFYKGYSSNLEERLKDHRCGHTRTTARMSGELTVRYTEEVETLNEALRREKYLKSAAGRGFLEKTIK